MIRVGLTGGIACGKSTVLACFEGLGWSVLSADILAKQVLQSDNLVWSYLKKQYGEAVFTSDESGNKIVDTKYLGKRVFSSPNELKQLEDLLHPRVREAWQRKMSSSESSHWVIEIPLLYEKGLESHFDQVVCVHVNEKTQIKRTMARGLSAEEAKARIDIQCDIREKINQAHLVITTSGTLQTLNEQVKAAHDILVNAYTP